MKIRCQWFSHFLKIVEICETICLVQATFLPESGPDEAENLKSFRVPEWDDPLAYLNEVTQLFSNRVMEYGVDNLVVPDKLYKVNDTRYGIHLLGTAEYKNGFVAEVHSVVPYDRDFMWYFEEQEAVVHFKINMVGVDVLYDLNAELEVAHLVGNADLNFTENNIQVYITHNTETLVTTLTSMDTNSVKGPATKFTPDSEEMRALAYNARLTMSSSLFGDLDLWINDPLRGFLEAVIQEVPFPLK